MGASVGPHVSSRASRAARARRVGRSAAGFSFTEVLFAVMILGVGFIMVAAIFPVAIQQAHTASDESVSAAVAWNAFAAIQAKFAEADLPAVGAPEIGDTGRRFDEDFYPGVVRSFRDPQAWDVAPLARGQPNGPDRPKRIGGRAFDEKDQVNFAQPADYLWNRIKGESVVADDRRFAWVAFYRRHIIGSSADDPAPYAQVVVVVARAREASAYGAKDVTPLGNLANLQPRRVRFDLTSDGDGPKVDPVVTLTRGETDAAVEGAYLVVAHDELPSAATARVPTAAQGALNCHVFRLGRRVAGDTWELSPEADFAARKVFGIDVRGLSRAEGYLIGRTRGDGGYAGVAQDVAVYTMIIPLQ